MVRAVPYKMLVHGSSSIVSGRSGQAGEGEPCSTTLEHCQLASGVLSNGTTTYAHTRSRVARLELNHLPAVLQRARQSIRRSAITRVVSIDRRVSISHTSLCLISRAHPHSQPSHDARPRPTLVGSSRRFLCCLGCPACCPEPPDSARPQPAWH